MLKEGLFSTYQIKYFKVYSKKLSVNRAEIVNKLERQFNGYQPYEIIVSDLTYVRVGSNWNYICLLTDLYNREIVGFSAGSTKCGQLVYEAFVSCEFPLNAIKVFHTDRGTEFVNNNIEQLLAGFEVERSLSLAGCPYDNAVAESLFQTLKIEFLQGKAFMNLEQLKRELKSFIYWYNNVRYHSSLGYLSPVEYKTLELNV